MSNNIPLNALTVNFEHQNTEDTCGAACAVMVLDAIRVVHPDQQTLFDEIQAFPTKDRGRNSEIWESSPDGLQDRLNLYSKPNHFFTLYAKRSQSLITRRMVWTIFHYKTPCIALISSGIHWVVVYQFYKTGKDPTSFNSVLEDAVQGFYILDPFEDVPTEGIVDYNEWRYRKQTPEAQGYWGEKYVALCDPDPGEDEKNKNMSKMKKAFGKGSQDPLNEANPSNAAKLNDTNKASRSKERKSKKANTVKALNTGLPITRIKKTGPDQGLIDDKTASAYSKWHLEHDGFYDSTKFTRMMESPEPGEPMLVRELDTKDFWYIVPFIEMSKQIGGVMRINAKDATFQEAAFAMHPDQPLTFTRLSNQQITELVIDKYGSSKEKINIESILVWKPCVESYSRFLPFYKVKMGTRTVYVRIDGKVYSHLSQRKRR